MLIGIPTIVAAWIAFMMLWTAFEYLTTVTDPETLKTLAEGIGK